MKSPIPLPVAIRVFPPLRPTEQKFRKNKFWRPPRAMLVFDTETTTDASQRLTFGSYRFFVDNEMREEGLFYADDLPLKDRNTLEKYAAAQNRQRTRCWLASISRSTYPALPSQLVQHEDDLQADSHLPSGRTQRWD